MLGMLARVKQDPSRDIREEIDILALFRCPIPAHERNIVAKGR